ncbi:MAG: hypothetical protein ACRDSR_04430 [Pseudonocardiaceae bacterium]
MQEMRHRLLFEQLEQWVEKLRGEEPVEPEVVKELAVRLLGVVVMLLQQHVVNKRGRCRLCRSSTWRWPFWCRRPRCTVLRSVDLAVGQGLDVVWWQLLGNVGQEARLEEVREWVEQRKKVV